MKKDNFGITIILINLLLSLFLLTIKEEKFTYFIVTIISNIIAIIFNIFVIKNQNRKMINIISLFINIIATVSLLSFSNAGL